MDYTTITAAVDWSAVLTGIGTIAVAIAGLLVAKRGAKILLGFIGR
ncbi:hypothetical protein L0E83_16410 [Marichromatium gracile]|nr:MULTISPECIES: hypothetical protein [Marichromatium]MCF1185016.1 hypothetical protein [Marichromatium gracile]